MNVKRLTTRALILLALLVAILPSATFVRAQSRQLKQIGNGTAFAAAWSPDGSKLAIGGSLGVWLYTPDLKPIAHFDGNDLEITALAWNPNGKQIASASHAGEVQLWDAASGKVQTLETTMPDSNEPGSLSYSPDGSRLASANAKNDVHIWDTATGKLAQTLKTDGLVYAVAWEPNGSRLAVGGAQTVGTDAVDFLQIWDTKSGKVTQKFSNDELFASLNAQNADPVQYIQWVNNILIITFAFMYPVPPLYVPVDILGWDMQANQRSPIDIFLPCGDQATGVRFSADGSIYAYGIIHCGGTPGVTSVASVTVETVNDYSQHGADVGVDIIRAMAWRPDNRTLAVVSGEGEILVYDTSHFNDADYFQQPAATQLSFIDTAETTSFAWSRDSSQLWMTSYEYAEDHLASMQVTNVLTDSVLSITQFSPLAGTQNSQAPDIQVWALSPDRKTLAGMEALPSEPKNSVQLYDATSGKPLTTDEWNPQSVLDDTQTAITQLSWSPGGKQIAALGNSVYVWDVHSGAVQTLNLGMLISGGTEFLSKLFWSPDSKNIALYNSDSSDAFAVFSLSQSLLLIDFKGDPKLRTLAVVWNPLNRSVAQITSDHVIRLWNVSTGKLLQTLFGHAVEWNADATRLAIAGEDKAVDLYDTSTAKIVFSLKSDADSTLSTAFSPDGKRIATADSDGAIRVWDVATGKLLLMLTGHKGAVEWVKWKPDGSQLLSKGTDGTLRLWDAHS
ncbi:MAG: WD40 repeat domain-containing protein [Aggregatilineales bacterium]